MNKERTIYKGLDYTLWMGLAEEEKTTTITVLKAFDGLWEEIDALLEGQLSPFLGKKLDSIDRAAQGPFHALEATLRSLYTMPIEAFPRSSILYSSSAEQPLESISRNNMLLRVDYGAKSSRRAVCEQLGRHLPLQQTCFCLDYDIRIEHTKVWDTT